MFLIRAAFWLSLVILLLPTGNTATEAGHDVGPEDDITAAEALGAARETISDLSSFCLRNPDTCATGSAAARLFGQKAQNGARMLYEYLADLDAGGGIMARNGAVEQAGADTLRAEDLEVPWQGPETRS